MSDQIFLFEGGRGNIEDKLPGGHSTEWFVYTYLTMKFTFWYYTHSQLLFGVDFLLTFANHKINLNAVLSCSGKVGYAAVVGIFDNHCKIPVLLILYPQNKCTLS